MQKNTGIIIAVAALVLGLGLGYAAKVNSSRPADTDDLAIGVHMMPDGSVMDNMGSASQIGSMSEMMAGMNAGLSGKTGDAFDRAFLSEMVIHHQGAVEMAKLALASAKHQEIKDLAKAIVSAQNKEIADMQAWQSAWYGR